MRFTRKMFDKYDVIVIGGGAAGMLAAITAAENGAKTLICEKNERLGRKLAITGKGRCNVTNNSDITEFMENVPRNGRFLYSAVTKFSSADTMEFFERLGVPLKTERGKRVFPQSDKAADVVNALVTRLDELGVEILRESVRSLIIKEGVITGVNTQHGQIAAKAVILAAGGASYPRTGSDGYGYTLAKQAGHTITEIRPSLCPLVTEEKWVSEAVGLTLKNAAVRLYRGNKLVYEDFGELSFTVDGVGGATVLSASAHIMGDPEEYSLSVDLKPALTEEKLDARILRDFGELKSGTFAEAVRKLLPKELCAPFAEITGIPLDCRIAEITKVQRKKLVDTLKGLKLQISDFRPIAEAIVTRGGISIKEIASGTMASKLCEGLFIAGEIIDVDAYTGGFNLQIAFSTGVSAGESAAVYALSE